jgi:anti-anti-sigma factor
MAAADFQIQISRRQDVVTVGLVGEAHLDFDAADKYIRNVLAQQPKEVVVDASRLTFISSVGMSFLINLLRAVQRAEATMTLHSLQPQVRKVLEHARVLQLFEGKADGGAPAQ